ncbi:hypothetical protein FA15DRAFT_759817 [Coprinopsis marcescibilis]|uniref:GPI inositol-deacylase winged helix domain-containing protein n=1 Tax=Coprinopsis marcescibilis TaxID=230819 RepID=A0A5C3KHV8_COPMA|nr:hypothetical protein FA15DRAFT_759817 [Coprinopsis marcescibilis]
MRVDPKISRVPGLADFRRSRYSMGNRYASVIIEHLQDLADKDNSICVVFAFCRYTDPIAVRDLLAALVRQHLERYPAAVWEFIKPFYDKHQRDRTIRSEQDFVDLLTLIPAPKRSLSLNIKFCITSRPLDALNEYVPQAVLIDILVHDGDIMLLINQKVDEIPSLRKLLLNAELKGLVVSKIIEKSSGMFLLASLQLDMLGQCLTVKSLKDSLERLPDGLHSMYSIPLQRINDQPNADVVHNALLWLVYARRSLTIDELRYAIAIDPNDDTFDMENLVDETVLLSLCCRLVAFSQKSRLVRLIHYTASDYLKPLL